MTRPSDWCVYLLECADGSIYCGVSNDIDRRIVVHNTGRGAKYTRSRLPVRLVYTLPAPDRSSALKTEAAIKRFSRRQKQELIAYRKIPR